MNMRKLVSSAILMNILAIERFLMGLYLRMSMHTYSRTYIRDIIKYSRENPSIIRSDEKEIILSIRRNGLYEEGKELALLCRKSPEVITKKGWYVLLRFLSEKYPDLSKVLYSSLHLRGVLNTRPEIAYVGYEINAGRYDRALEYLNTLTKVNSLRFSRMIHFIWRRRYFDDVNDLDDFVNQTLRFMISDKEFDQLSKALDYARNMNVSDQVITRNLMSLLYVRKVELLVSLFYDKSDYAPTFFKFFDMYGGSNAFLKIMYYLSKDLPISLEFHGSLYRLMVSRIPESADDLYHRLSEAGYGTEDIVLSSRLKSLLRRRNYEDALDLIRKYPTESTLRISLYHFISDPEIFDELMNLAYQNDLRGVWYSYKIRVAESFHELKEIYSQILKSPDSGAITSFLRRLVSYMDEYSHPKEIIGLAKELYSLSDKSPIAVATYMEVLRKGADDSYFGEWRKLYLEYFDEYSNHPSFVGAVASFLRYNGTFEELIEFKPVVKNALRDFNESVDAYTFMITSYMRGLYYNADGYKDYKIAGDILLDLLEYVPRMYLPSTFKEATDSIYADKYYQYLLGLIDRFEEKFGRDMFLASLYKADVLIQLEHLGEAESIIENIKYVMSHNRTSRTFLYARLLEAILECKKGNYRDSVEIIEGMKELVLHYSRSSLPRLGYVYISSLERLGIISPENVDSLWNSYVRDVKISGEGVYQYSHYLRMVRNILSSYRNV